MKINTKTIIRLVIIGAFHASVFLWLVPFVILPRFGEINPGRAVGIVAVLVAVITAVIFLYPVSNPCKKSENKGEKSQ